MKNLKVFTAATWIVNLITLVIMLFANESMMVWAMAGLEWLLTLIIGIFSGVVLLIMSIFVKK